MGKDLEILTNELTEEDVTNMVIDLGEEVDSTGFKENFDKMYKIADKIAIKILSKGKTIKDDSYVVREEFGEALAAGFRYLKLQTEVGKETRAANHSEDSERDFENDMYKEFADVFMMTTTFCRHNEWTLDDKSFNIVRPIHMSIEEYLTKTSEVLLRMNYHYNGNEINCDYIYEFLEETFVMMKDHKDVLSNKIDKFYNKIFKVIEEK